MLIRRRQHPLIDMKFMRFAVAITSTLIVIFVVYSHSSFVDAFSLGCRTLPLTQLCNQQVSPDSLSFAAYHTRKPFNPSSRLETKSASGDYDSSSPFFAKRDLDEDAKIVGSSSNSPPSPFFAESEDSFQMNSESPILNKQVDENESKIDLKKVDNSSGDFVSPFFANKEDQFQISTESLIPNEIESTEEWKEVYDSGGDSASPFFATKKGPFLTNEDLKKVGNFGGDFSSPVFAKKEDIQPPIAKQQSQNRPFDPSPFTSIERIPINNRFTADSEEVRGNYNPWPRFDKDEYTGLVDSSQEYFDNTIKTVVEVIKYIPSKVDKTVDTSQKILKDAQEMTRNVNKSIQVTKQTVEETIEKTQETVKDIQKISIKVKQSLEETKQVVEETVEKTQEAVKDVQDLSIKVKQSLEDTRQTVEKKVEKTQETIKDAQDFSKKMSESKAASKAKVLFQIEPPTTIADEALVFAGKATIAVAKLALWGTKGVGSLTLKGSQSIYDNTIGPEVEEVWNDQLESLSGSVEKATKAWEDKMESLNSSVEEGTLFVKNTPSRVKSVMTGSIVDRRSAGKQPRSIQQDSPSVLGKGGVKNESSSTTRDPAIVARRANAKTQSTWIERGSASVSSITKGESQPAIVSRKEAEEDLRYDNRAVREGKNEGKKTMPVEKIVSKSPEDLNMELQEAEKLAKEISDSLDAAERAMNSNIELEEPMIQIEKKSMDRIETKLSIAKKKDFIEKKSKRKIGMGKMLSRFKRPSFKTAKSQDELDVELEEAESLAKEIADALHTAEQSLNATSENVESIKKEIDE